MDVTHKAGKTLWKEIPNFYKANPEFMGKRSQAIKDIAAIQEVPSAVDKPKKKKKNTTTEDNAEAEKHLQQQKLQERTQELIN